MRGTVTARRATGISLVPVLILAGVAGAEEGAAADEPDEPGAEETEEAEATEGTPAEAPPALGAGSPEAEAEALQLVKDAQGLVGDGRIVEAIDLAARAADLTPDLPEPRALLGRLHLKIGDCAQAIHHLSELVRLSPEGKEAKKAAKAVAECETSKKRRGKLALHVEPAGAAVRIHAPGREAPVAAGAGSVQAELPAGTYRLEARLAGRQDLTATVRVLARQTTDRSYSLAWRPCSLEVKTVPAGAAVTLDGKPAGTAPVRIEPVTPGDHELVATLEGHGAARAQVRLQPGQRAELELRPEPAPARLQVTSNAEGAWVEVGGLSACQAPCPVELAAGDEHLVGVRAHGHLPAQRELLPKPGEASTLELALEEDPLAADRRSRQRWGLVVTATGAALLAGGMVALVQGFGSARDAEAAYARYSRAETPTTLGSAWGDAASQDERAELRTAVGLGMLAAGAVAGVLGTRWWLTEPLPEGKGE